MREALERGRLGVGSAAATDDFMACPAVPEPNDCPKGLEVALEVLHAPGFPRCCARDGRGPGHGSGRLGPQQRVRPLVLLRDFKFDMEISQLPRGDRRRRLGHEVHAFGGLGKRDDVPDAWGSAENRIQSIEA
jgi:hypothetical protein